MIHLVSILLGLSLVQGAQSQVALIGCDDNSAEYRVQLKKEFQRVEDPWADRRLRLGASQKTLIRCGSVSMPSNDVKVLGSTPDISTTQNLAVHFPKQGPLQASLIFGVIDPKGRQLGLSRLADELRRVQLPWNQKTGERLFRSDMKLADKTTRYEPGAMELLSFFRHIGKIVVFRKIAIGSVTGGAIEFQMSGRLKSSTREISLKVYFGKTPGHESFFREALERSDVVIYNGHAGQGENLKLSRVGKFTPLSRYQLLGLFNCHSYSYFGEEIFKARRALKTDLLLSTTSDAGNYYVIQLLETLDRNLAGEAVDLEKAFDRRKEFLVLKRQTP